MSKSQGPDKTGGTTDGIDGLSRMPHCLDDDRQPSRGQDGSTTSLLNYDLSNYKINEPILNRPHGHKNNNPRPRRRVTERHVTRTAN